ncbi:unnamed protein product [Clonostachys byssicola]|uniref:C3H1-type domain-containing protein n=1 Tax=Clonostachys byssicola TaxID=160290 RepID=A0A9N9U0I8_9HYPO|nr:unnamed protein product [Clonostachys byssicola]
MQNRHSRNGSMGASNGAHGSSNAAAAARFEGPRSPPNTSHVPCKFFRQGACQAGNACPFSHDLGAASDNICKYFAKGNCKFGPKCANIHVLPDGRRINYSKNGVTIGNGPVNLGARSAQAPTSPTSSTPATNGADHNRSQASASALTNSLYRADQSSLSTFPFDDRHNQHNLRQQPSLENGLPIIDAPYSHTSSAYGSPRDEDARFGLGLSPSNGKGLSVMDAPLPASFDSNGISNAALYPGGPWPSSVPSKFGLESHSPSLSIAAKDSPTSETLRLLHTQAFGSSEHLATPLAGSLTNSQYGSGTEEYFGKRTMHSARYTKPRMLSSSLPKASAVDYDWQAEFAFEDDVDDDNLPENYVPENLQDLLTPAEKARRGSIRVEGDVSIDGITKYGSPIGTSPGRWGVFPRGKEDDDLSRSARAAPSMFGHVGSPLRNSTLAQEMDGLGSTTRPFASRSGSESMSVLSQQLQRSRIDDAPGASSPLLHPAAARNTISSLSKDRHLERHVSSGSISSSVTGRFTTPIDEEDPAFVFSMEEEEDPTLNRARKRGSAGLAMGGWGSYASAVSGKGTTNGSKEGRDSVAINGQ